MSACPYCHVAVRDAGHACPGCSTPHHTECWSENQGCAVSRCDFGPQVLFASEPVGHGGWSGNRLTIRFDEEDEPAPRKVPAPRVRRCRHRPVRDQVSAAAAVGVCLLVALVVALTSGGDQPDARSVASPASAQANDPVQRPGLTGRRLRKERRLVDKQIREFRSVVVPVAPVSPTVAPVDPDGVTQQPSPASPPSNTGNGSGVGGAGTGRGEGVAVR